MNPRRNVSLVALALVAPALVGVAAAHADGLVAPINASRSSNHLAPLAAAGDLASLAQSHSAEMARTGKLAHSSNLPAKVSNWTALGENVGEGGSYDAVERAFMGSSVHRANILNGCFKHVAIGATRVDGVLWVTVFFYG